MRCNKVSAPDSDVEYIGKLYFCQIDKQAEM